MVRPHRASRVASALAGVLLAACVAAPVASPSPAPGSEAPASPVPTAGAAPSPSGPTASWSTTGACPPAPWTLASILDVPTGYEPGIWEQAAAARARCFADTSIRFTAQVWFLNSVFPGVELAAAMGHPYRIRLDDPATSIDAFVPSDAAMDEPTRLALGRTGGDGGLAMEAWFEVTGHFNDAAAAGCHPHSGDTVDDRAVLYSDAEAVAFCLDQFVVQALQWVQPQPTPIPTLPPADAVPGPPSELIGATFAGVCPGELYVRTKFPCVAVALGWSPAADTVALYRIHANWTGEGPDATCNPTGSVVYVTGVGITGARFVVEPQVGGGGLCLWIEAANEAGSSAWVRFDGDFSVPSQ